MPAGGRARRLPGLECSKEIYPLGGDAGNPSSRSLPACHSLLDAMAVAGARTAYVVLGHGKWDIAARLGTGAEFDLDLAYLVIRDSPSTVATVDRAFGFLRDRLVLFGFPDVVFTPRDALARLARHQASTDADVVLGTFPADRPEKVDMVRTDAGGRGSTGRVRAIEIKIAGSVLRRAWMLAIWTPAFSAFLHDWAGRDHAALGREAYVGDVVQAAIDDGWRVEAVHIAEGVFRDIGTPDDLAVALREASGGRGSVSAGHHVVYQEMTERGPAHSASAKLIEGPGNARGKGPRLLGTENPTH